MTPNINFTISFPPFNLPERFKHQSLCSQPTQVCSPLISLWVFRLPMSVAHSIKNMNNVLKNNTLCPCLCAFTRLPSNGYVLE